MQVIFDFNSNSPRHSEVLSEFKNVVGQAGGEVRNFGMGVHGVDPTFVIKGDEEAVLAALVANGYTAASSGADDSGLDGSVSITPPYMPEQTYNQSHVGVQPRQSASVRPACRL